MRMFLSTGYKTEDLSTKVIFGYFIEGENGLFTFSESETPETDAVYDIQLDSTAEYIDIV